MTLPKKKKTTTKEEGVIEEVVSKSKRKTGEEQTQREVGLQRKNGCGHNEGGEKMHNI